MEKDPLPHPDAAGEDLFGLQVPQDLQEDMGPLPDRIETVLFDIEFGEALDGGFHDRLEVGFVLFEGIAEGVDLVEGVVASEHDPSRQGPGGPADPHGQPAAEALGEGLETLTDIGPRLLEAAPRVGEELFEPDGPQVQRDRLDDASLPDQCHIGGTAADIDGDPLPDREQVQGGHGAVAGLPESVNDPDLQAEALTDDPEKSFPIGRVPQSGGGDTVDFADFVFPEGVGKGVQGPEGPADADRLKISPRLVGPFTDTDPALLLDDEVEAVAAGPLEDHQTGGVGADIDDGDTFGHRRLSAPPAAVRI